MKNLLAGKEIVEKKLIWFLIPLIIIVIAAITFGIFAGVNGSASEGINMGIDFTGGTMVTVSKDGSGDNFNAFVKEASDIVKENGGKVEFSQLSGEGEGFIIRFGLESTEVNDNIKKALIEKYSEENLQITTIGATASRDLVATAVGAVALSTLLILVYIVIRFRNFATGISAVCALLQDVLMVIAFTIIFNIQINSSFVAALITIIAYSINNSIVIFDRIRFNTSDTATKDLPRNDIVNRSIAQTLTRSINTTVTTMAAIVVLAIIGVSSIKEFALPVIFGLLAGAYSSVFFAPSLYCVLRNGSDKFKARPKKQKKSSAKDTTKA